MMQKNYAEKMMSWRMKILKKMKNKCNEGAKLLQGEKESLGEREH